MLPEKLRTMEPYEPLSGTFDVRLDANESFIPPDDSILTALSKLQLNRYPDPYSRELCTAFAAYYGIDPERVTAGNGSDELIGIILSSFLGEGDKALCFSHDFSMYKFYLKLYEKQIVIYNKPHDLTVDIDEVLRIAEANNVRLIIFSNPCNPTSLGIKREEIIRLIESTKAIVVLDEAYMDFFNQSLIKLDFSNLIILRTMSKALGLAGARLGFAVAGCEYTRALQAVKSPYNVNILSQAAGTAALSNKALIDENIRRIISSRDMLYSRMCAMKSDEIVTVFPTCTNFVFVRMRDAQSVFTVLLERGISVRVLGDCLRITAGNERENDVLISALEDILSIRSENT